MAELLRGNQRWDDYAIPPGGVLNQIGPIDGVIQCLAEPDVAPRASGLQHVELTEHRLEAPPTLHDGRRSALRDSQRFHRAQISDYIHPSLARLDDVDSVLLAQRVVEDDSLHVRRATLVPVIGVGFQDHPTRAPRRRGNSLDQLVGSRAPRARAVDDSPVLLAPTHFPVELAVGDVHDGELDEGASIRFREDESDRLGVDNLELRSRPEVHVLPYDVGLAPPGVLLPVELNDLGIELLAVVEFDVLPQLHL